LPPADLSQPAEAPSGRKAGAGKLFLGRLLLFFGGWFILLAWQESCYQQAQRVRGVVIEKGYTRGAGGVGRGSTGSTSSHWVRYRFTTEDGATKEQVDNRVLPKIWNELEQGGPVDIEYMPSLADSRVAGSKASAATYAAIAAGLLVAGFLIVRVARR
jgi:hypothetical protein